MNTITAMENDAKFVVDLGLTMLDSTDAEARAEARRVRNAILARHHAAGTTDALVTASEAYAATLSPEAAQEPTIKCEYASDCTDHAEYLGRKGYVYCPRHRGRRLGYEATRPLRKWEQARILAGKPLVGWSATQAETRAYDANEAFVARVDAGESIESAFHAVTKED